MTVNIPMGSGDFVEKRGSGTTLLTFTPSDIPNVQVGDVILAMQASQGVDTSSTVLPAPPTGWVNIGFDMDQPSTDPRALILYAYSIADTTALTTWQNQGTVTIDDGVSGSYRRNLTVMRVTGADLNLNNYLKTLGSVQASASATQTVAALSPTTPGMWVALASLSFTPQTNEPDLTNVSQAGATKYLNKNPVPASSVSNTVLAIAYIAFTTVTAVGARNLTWNYTPGNNAVAFAIFIPAAPVTGKPGKTVKNDGTLKDSEWLVVKTDGSMKSPDIFKVFPYGYRTVDAMLSKAPFYIAHRGGSYNYPEMSLHAYTQSGFMGYGAFELSLARTQDGVWFGLHDASLDRTSQQSGGGSGTNLVAANMTWAQVQAYAISAWQTDNTSQIDRPYVRLEDLLSAYPSRVWLIDPKAALANRIELLDLIESLMPNAQKRVIAKFYGVGTSSWASLASGRGYKTWGYFYEGDDIATYQAQWDILGLNVEAAQATWDQYKTFGKKVIGHTPKTQALAAQGLARGADGLMVAGTLAVSPS